MKTARRFLPILTIMLMGLITMPEKGTTTRQDGGQDLGFPFEIISERLSLGIGPPTWQAFINVPRPYYSRENLDRLFRFYSLRHPNMAEKIIVSVYARPLNHPLSSPTVANGMNDSDRWDTLFFREGDGLGSAGRNEYYSYKPNLDDPAEENLVILKGTLFLRQKKVVETWKVSNADLKIRVFAYYLEGVEPAGVYYTFQTFKADWSEWQSIMTFRQDQRVPIPADSVVSISDTTSYILMGSMYAVTRDGGRTWSVWDAERDFELGRWCDHWLIDSVQIAPNGKGKMRLLPNSQSSAASVLHTHDFGIHWNPQ